MFEVETHFMNWTNVTSVAQISTPSRVLLIILNILIVVFGICGNGFVLFLSKKHNALKMDKMSVILLENLAIADIIIVFTKFIPMLLIMILDRWVLGKVMCGLVGYFQLLPIVAEVLLTTSLTCHRIHVLKRPLHAGMMRTRTGHLFAFLVWGVSLTYLMVCMIRLPVVFHPLAFSCVSIYHSSGTDLIIDTLFLYLPSRIIPMLVTVLGNIYVLYIVAKSLGRMGERELPGRHAVITTSIISGCFIIAMLPEIIVYILVLLEGPLKHLTLVQWVILSLCQQYILALNVVINPLFIYYWRNKTFRRAVKDILTGKDVRDTERWSKGGGLETNTCV